MSVLPAPVPYPHVMINDEGSPYIETGTPTERFNGRLGPRKLFVHRLFQWHRHGTTCETLLRRYPGFGPAKIFSALAFAYDNRELIAADDLRDREAIAKIGKAYEP